MTVILMANTQIIVYTFRINESRGDIGLVSLTFIHLFS